MLLDAAEGVIVKEVVKKQIELNKAANLLFPLSHKIHTIDESFRDTLISLKAANVEIPDELIEDIIDLVMEKIYAINQFINIDRNGRARLRKLYTYTYNRITEDNFLFVMEEHCRSLADIVSSFYPDEIKTALEKNEVLGTVLNKEYSLDLQLHCFDMDPGRIQVPFIDVGCGTSASLLNYLIENGVDAFGIDRNIRSDSDRIRRCDWLEYDFSSHAWGTVYSNMAFTNHFLHNSNYGDQGVQRRYREKYEEILESLQKNGEFIYAPGLADVERDLDSSKFTVTRRVMIRNVSITKIRRISI